MESEALGGANTLIGRITALVGLLTGAVAIVYAAGAVVYWAALSNRDVPSNLAIATSLPREFLVGTGVLFVALPLVLVGLVLLALTPILVKSEDWGLWVLAAFLLLGGGGLVVAAHPCSVWTIAGAVVGAVATAALLTYILFLVVQERSTYLDNMHRRLELRERELQSWARQRSLSAEEQVELQALDEERAAYETDRAGRRQRLTYWIGIGVAAILAWGVVIGIARTDLPPAKLCTTDGGQYPGFLIGETGDRVYIGEAGSRKQNRQIISTPTGEVSKLFIGSDEASCQVEAALGESHQITPAG